MRGSQQTTLECWLHCGYTNIHTYIHTDINRKKKAESGKDSEAL